MHVKVGLARDALLRRHRSFEVDARACMARLSSPLRLFGEEHVPENGACVITLNHYCRPGFASQRSALAISASVPAHVHWIMTAEWTFPGKWFAPFGMPFSRFILKRIARAYGFTTMPPMPPRPRDVEARATSVRRVLRYVKQSKDPIIAIAPEGGDQPEGKLSLPPRGVGRFCLLLADAGLRFLPVGVYECDGQLTLNFGESYDLHITPATAAHEKDRLAARNIMCHIAELLPLELRGDFNSGLTELG
jgi:hypothetical protein